MDLQIKKVYQIKKNTHSIPVVFLLVQKQYLDVLKRYLSALRNFLMNNRDSKNIYQDQR
jgi:hypothetical protein